MTTTTTTAATTTSPAATTTSPAATAVRAHPTRKLAAALLTATALLLGACGSDGTEAGDDLSADVEIAGVSGEGGESRPANDRETPPGPADDSAPSDEPAQPTDAADDPSTARILPAIAFDNRVEGRSATYLGIEITLGSLISTNQTLDEFTASADPTDDREIIIAEVAVTNSGSGDISLPEELFAIQLASGERVAPEDVSAPDGEWIWAIEAAAGSTRHALLAFPELDLEGASFVIAEGGAIAEYIPLDGPATTPEPYVVGLAALPAVGDLRSPSPWDGCDYAWTGEAVAASVTLEGVDGRRLDRASLNERWLGVELLVTNDTTRADEFYPCNSAGMAITAIEPRLRIGGVAMSPENSVPIGDRLDEGVGAIVTYWFPIDASTSRVELTDIGGTVIAGWDLDLPAAPGEG